MTNDGQWEFLDLITISSFILTFLNYNENLDQNALSDSLDKAVGIINSHLKEQDKKLDIIIKKLGDGIND